MQGFPTLVENWESIIAVPTFRGGNLSELKLYPISLGYGAPRQVRGRPLFAEQDLARKIIGDLQRLSEPYGTEIVFRRGIGTVELTNTD